MFCIWATHSNYTMSHFILVYILVVQFLRVVFHWIHHESLVFSCYTRCIRRVCKYTKKTKVTCGIFHAIPHETAAQLFYNTTWKIQGSTVSMQRAIGRLGVIPSRIQRLSCILIVAWNENGYRRNAGISLEVDTYSTQGRRDIHSRFMLQTPEMSKNLENSLLSFCGHSNSMTC